MRTLVIALGAALFLVGCDVSGDPDVAGPSSFARCQETRQGDSVTVVRCGDDTGPVVPAVPE
jgi:hypothetical protein